MKISIYFKDLIEQLWQYDKKQAALDQKTAQVCLRCGKPLDQRMVINALSRHADVYICRECGTDEALLDAFGEPLPLRDWHAVTSGRVGRLSPAAPSLMAVCTFEHIFEGPKKRFPLSSAEHPASEAAYLRADYDGHKWWRTWFRSDGMQLENALADEIDQFSNALLEMPEFQSLDAMGRMCRSCAQLTDSTTDFNLYSETGHFYIWLQLVTRKRDYNLYVHFYLKSQAN